MERLLKRLGLGLILVHFPAAGPDVATVEVLFHPILETKPRQRPKQRRAILREIAGRSDDYNVGGSTRRPLLTAYREQAIRIVLCLESFGPQSPAALRRRGCADTTQAILRRDVYKWFERLERGVYAVRPAARTEILANWPVFMARCQEGIEGSTAEGILKKDGDAV
jgi:hypothetical protein